MNKTQQKKRITDSDYSTKYRILINAGQRSYKARKEFLDNDLDFCAEYLHRALKRERGHCLNILEMGHRLKAIDPNTTNENLDRVKAMNELREWDMKNPKRDTYSDYSGHWGDYMRGYYAALDAELIRSRNEGSSSDEDENRDGRNDN